MQPGAGFLDILILMGALQGFIVSALLLFNNKKTEGDRFFSVLLLLISLACLNIYLLDINFSSYSSIVNILAEVVPVVILIPVGPLAYFYIRSLLTPDFKFKHKDRIHFYPVVIDLIPNITALIYICGSLLNLHLN